MPGSMSAHLGTRRPALLALRRRIPPPLASLPRRSELPGAVVAGARYIRQEQAIYGAFVFAA